MPTREIGFESLSPKLFARITVLVSTSVILAAAGFFPFNKAKQSQNEANSVNTVQLEASSGVSTEIKLPLKEIEKRIIEGRKILKHLLLEKASGTQTAEVRHAI